MAKERRKGEVVQGIPTDDWNEFCRMTKAVKQLTILRASTGASATVPHVTLEVFNTTDGPLTALFPILKLDEPAFPPSSDRENVAHQEPISFNGVTPDEDTKATDIVVVQGTLAKNQSGAGVILGPTLVQIEWTSESHEAATVKAGDNTQLTSAGSGIKVLWHEEIPGADYLPATLWAVVNLGGSDPFAEQLALVTEVVFAGDADPEVRYAAPYDTDFQIQSLPTLRCVLLDTDNESGLLDGALHVYNPEALALEDLEFFAWDLRREGNPAYPWEVVRVWKVGGGKIIPAENNQDGETVLPTIFAESINPTDYLRGLPTWDESVPQFFVHDADDPTPQWVALDDVTGGTWPPGGGGPGDGDTVAEGYCIEIVDAAGVKTIHHDAISAAAGIQAVGIAAGEFQFWFHAPGATTRGDAQWNTADDYDVAEDQEWWHRSGNFEFKTVADYDAGEMQFRIHTDDGDWKFKTADTYNATHKQLLFNDAGTWKWKTINGYDDTKIQLFGHANDGTWHAKTIAEWLNQLDGYDLSDDQVIQHEATANTTWQDTSAC